MYSLPSIFSGTRDVLIVIYFSGIVHDCLLFKGFTMCYAVRDVLRSCFAVLGCARHDMGRLREIADVFLDVLDVLVVVCFFGYS